MTDVITRPITVTYFKRSGKFYTEATFLSAKTMQHEVIEEFERLRDQGEAPGLTTDGKTFSATLEMAGCAPWLCAAREAAADEFKSKECKEWDLLDLNGLQQVVARDAGDDADVGGHKDQAARDHVMNCKDCQATLGLIVIKNYRNGFATSPELPTEPEIDPHMAAWLSYRTGAREIAIRALLREHKRLGELREEAISMRLNHAHESLRHAQQAILQACTVLGFDCAGIDGL